MSINVPIVDYFTLAGKKYLIDDLNLQINAQTQYTLDERFRYGFSISIDEYGISINELVLSLNKTFKNRINIR